MHLNGASWKTFFGRENEPGPSFDPATSGDQADPMNLSGSGSSGHFLNFITAVRSGDWSDLTADILDGHKSTSMIHLANISYRTGRELEFDSHSERFIGDDQANGYLTRKYRYPYVVPDEV